jgi:hypothetical protein
VVEDLVLRDLLDQAAGTRFGQDHALSTVRSFDDWRAAVPVRRYSDFSDYIAEIVDGRRSVLTRSDPYALLTTSGTSGQAKLVPMTSHWRTSYRGPALYAQWGLHFHVLGLREVTAGTALDLSWDREPASKALGSIPVLGITQRFETLGVADWTPPWFDASWFTTRQGGTLAERLYVRVRLLAGSDVRLVVAVNPSKLVLLGQMLETSADELITDIATGRLFGAPHPGLDPDPELARLLERRRARRGSLLLTDVFPKLSLAVTWRSAGAALYQPLLEKMLPSVPVLPFSTTGTEGIVTLPIDSHPTAGPLAVDQGLFEFVPTTRDGDDTPLPPDVETLRFDQLETRAHYRLVMSQASGLFRYDVGDVYQVLGWVGRVPRLEFVGRAGNTSSFTGEKLGEEDVWRSARLAAGSSEIPPLTFVPVWGSPPRYVAVVESGSTTRMSSALEGPAIEAALQRLNSEYREKRRSGRLGPLTVLPVAPGALQRVMDHRIAQGAPDAQVKHTWLQRDSQLLELIERLNLQATTAESEEPAHV